MSVNITDSVTTIGSYAFQRNFLTDVTIADSVTTIGSYAFQHNLLRDVTIGRSVKSIGEGAFPGLENEWLRVTFKGNAPSITRAGATGTFGTGVDTRVYRDRNATGFGHSWDWSDDLPYWEGYRVFATNKLASFESVSSGSALPESDADQLAVTGSGTLSGALLSGALLALMGSILFLKRRRVAT